MSIYRLCLPKVHVNLHTHWLRQKTLKMILKCMSIWSACLPTVYIYIECTMYILYTLDTFVRTLWDTKSAYPCPKVLYCSLSQLDLSCAMLDWRCAHSFYTVSSQLDLYCTILDWRCVPGCVFYWSCFSRQFVILLLYSSSLFTSLL